MDSNALYISFSEIDDEILERSESTVVSCGISGSRRLTAVLIAAILALFLMGASAAVILWGDSIQSWFAYHWERITGEPMSEPHAVLIDHLSQEIGLRETVDGVTVTVDSAVVGEKCFFILLRVEGAECTPKNRYGFVDALVLLKNSAEHGMSGAGYSYTYLGMDPKGAALLLLKYDYTTRNQAPETRLPMQISLSMKGFAQDPLSYKEKLLAEGEWIFDISLDRGKIDTRSLPDTQVMGIDHSKKGWNKETPILLTNMVLTNTNLSFQYDWRGGDVVMDVRLQQIRVVLKNGQEISACSGGATAFDGGERYVTYTWWIPVSLNEVAAVKIGEVMIPVG